MLFFSLENQLFLIMVLILSSWLFMSALVIRYQRANLRAFELAFILPLFLTAVSYLTSAYNNAGAFALLVLSHIFLLFYCTVVLFTQKETDSLRFFSIFPFVLIPAAWSLSNSQVYTRITGLLYFIILGLVIFNLALTIHTLFQKNKEKLAGFLGLFMLGSGMGLWLVSGNMALEFLFLMFAGYISCIVYVYKNSLRIFFREYENNAETVKRLNSSIRSEVIRRVEEIERSNRRLLQLSKTDNMTGLLLKSVVVKNLEACLERSPQTSLSVLIFDIDKFKNINDTMGHQIGDQCIRALANLAQSSFRRDDILGRYGGDEFLVLLPGTPPVKAFLIGDRFRQLVESRSNPKITISVGISNYPEDAKTAITLIEAADKALYASKQKGRNAVTLYSSLE